MTTREQLPTTSGAAFRARAVTPWQRWLLLAAAAWMIVGLQLDAFAHGTVPDLETFWTPWHAVMYSGIAATGASLAWVLSRQLPFRGFTYPDLLALPTALKVAVAGMALLLVGGGIDTLWHNLFGIEQGLEIFVSPSHHMLIAGMVLVAAAPMLMRWAEPDDGRPNRADTALVLVSTVLSGLPLLTYVQHASVLGSPQLGTSELETTDVGYLSGASAVHGYALSTILLMAAVAALGHRWRLPRGVGLVLVAVPNAVMWASGGLFSPWLWYVAAVALGAALAEVIVRSGARLLPPMSDGSRWLILGALTPMVVWGTVFALASTVVSGENANGMSEAVPYAWNVHITTGLLSMTAILGALTVAIVRRLLPPAR
ncbi:MAG: hypothetical protein ACRCYQ_09860 [Nocardioides sp.]